MLTKKEQRLRRARQTRIRIAQQGVARLTVSRTNLHIYASVISGCGTKVLASASTAEAEVRTALGASGKGGNAAAATVIGKQKLLALRRSPSTAQDSLTTVASRLWPRRPVKQVCSSKRIGDTNG